MVKALRVRVRYTHTQTDARTLAHDLCASSTPLFAHFGLCPPIERYDGHMDLEQAFALRRNMYYSRIGCGYVT